MARGFGLSGLRPAKAAIGAPRIWLKAKIRSPIRATIVAAMLLVILVACLAGLVMKHVYWRDLDEAKRELETFDGLLAQQTEQTFQNIMVVEQQTAQDLAEAGLTGPGDLERIASNQSMHDQLRHLASGIPQLDALTLISSSGDLINFTRSWPVPAINVSGLALFKHLAGLNGAKTWLTEPRLNRFTGKWTIYIGSRLSGPHNEFAGIISAAVRIDSFQDFYRNLNLPSGSSIALWRDDGFLLTRYPSTPKIGHLLSGHWLFQGLPPGQSRIGIVHETLDGKPRLVAVRHLLNQPIIIACTRSMNAVLAEWWFDVGIVGATAILRTLAILGVAMLVIRRFRGYEAVTTLLTAREEAERNLRHAESRMLNSQKLEAIGRLTAGIGHDFNNLLTVVRANAELLSSGASDTKTARRLASICQAADRGAVLTRQMLAFARQQILDPRSLDLNRTLRDISDLLQSSVGSRVTLSLEFQEALWPAFADSSQLGQAILNLVLNARDALPDGGNVTIGTANVTIETPVDGSQIAPGDYVRITVTDNGIGMAADIIPHVFDPFFTTKEQGKGTGLGLSQAQGFARQSEGDIWLQSTLEQGTRITILLPRAAEKPANAVLPWPAIADTPKPTGIRSKPMSMPTVLLIDDEELVRIAASSLLRQNGFQVIECATARDAINTIAQRNDIDIVLTDYAMPDIAGQQLAEILRRTAPDRPIVFMTGLGNPDELTDERWVIRKPFKGDDLCQLMREAASL